MVKNPAPAGFAIKIRQNPAPVGFGKSESGTTLVIMTDINYQILLIMLRLLTM